jgi:hypothetical protein
MSNKDIQALKNKYKLWKILHSREKTHYCIHCKNDMKGHCWEFRDERALTQLGFCHIFLLEGNYVK